MRALLEVRRAFLATLGLFLANPLPLVIPSPAYRRRNLLGAAHGPYRSQPLKPKRRKVPGSPTGLDLI